MNDQRSTDTPADDAEDTALGRSSRAPQGYEVQPDPSAEPDETGRQAAGEAERLEGHSRPTTQPEEPGAPDAS